MPEPDSQDAAVDRAGWSFGQLLGWHLTHGTRPGGGTTRPGRAWGTKDVAGRLGVSDRTVRNWLNDQNLPADTDAIEALLFGNVEKQLDDPFGAWRLELRRARAGNVVAPPPEVKDSRTGGGMPIHLPYPSLGHLFMGRDSFLSDLRASLAQAAGGRTAIVSNAIHGMGGIGKTRAAVEYAWAHEKDYTALLFVQADTPDNLAANLAALTGPLRLAEHTATEQSVRLHAALAWLRANPGWFLILDNVDSEPAKDAALAMLGGLSGGHVVLTSRLDRGAWHGVTPLELDGLSLDDAAAFLLEATKGTRLTRADDEAQARTVAEDLGQLALALDLAAATIRQRRCSFAEYRALWHDSRDKVKLWNDQRTTGYHTAVAETWRTSVALVSPEARTLLERLAFLAPDPVPGFLLDVPVPGAEPLDAWEALLDLATYSLVTRDPAGDRFTVNRLIQDATRRGLDPATARQCLTESLGWLNAAFTGDAQDVRTWPRLDPLSAHAESVAWAADKAGIAGPTGRLMVALGNLFYAKAQIARAEPLMRRALAIDEASLGPDHPTVAIDLNNLAQLLRSTNRLAEAEPLMRRTLAIGETSLGTDHPEVATRLNNLAQLLQDTNRPTEAEPLMRRALAIGEASLGPDHPTVAIRLNNLAHLLQATNRPAEAEPLMRRALAIDEASLGSDHPNVAVRLNNFAQLLQDANRLVEAEPLMRRALAIDEVSFGADHPRVATDLSNLAALLQETNRLAESEPLMRRAMTIDEAIFGPDHPRVAIRLNNLATLLLGTNRLTEAEPLMHRALAIDEASFGPDHPNLAIRLNNLARLLMDLGRLDEATTLLRRGLLILFQFERETLFPHPNVSLLQSSYEIALRKGGLKDEEIDEVIISLRRQAGLLEIDSSLPEESQTSEQPDLLPKLPPQVAGPHFTIDDNGLVVPAPPEELDREGNNVGRLRRLHPMLLDIAQTLLQDLSAGNIPHPDLRERAKTYTKLLDQPLDSIDFYLLWAEGVRLANAAQSSRKQIDDGEAPPFSTSVDERLRSILMLHGTFVLSTVEGAEAISSEQRYQRRPLEETQYQVTAAEFAAALQNRPDIIRPDAASMLQGAVEQIGKGTNPERSGALATGALQNVAIALTGAATVAALPVAGSIALGPAGTVAGALIAFLGRVDG